MLVSVAEFNAEIRDRFLAVPFRIAHGNGSLGNVSTGETDWYSASVPANTLFADGMSIRLRVAGHFAANGNSKTIRLKWAGTTYLTLTTSQNGGFWSYEVVLTRISSTQTRARVVEFITTTAPATTPREVRPAAFTTDFTVINTLVQTGQGAATSDLVVNDYKALVEPAA